MRVCVLQELESAQSRAVNMASSLFCHILGDRCNVVVTTGGFVSLALRDFLQNVTKARVRDRYGTTEVCGSGVRAQDNNAITTEVACCFITGCLLHRINCEGKNSKRNRCQSRWKGLHTKANQDTIDVVTVIYTLFLSSPMVYRQ